MHACAVRARISTGRALGSEWAKCVRRGVTWNHLQISVNLVRHHETISAGGSHYQWCESVAATGMSCNAICCFPEIDECCKMIQSGHELMNLVPPVTSL
jgi:hypothetical protein